MTIEVGTKVPEITFMYREGDEAPEEGGCPIGGEFVPTTTEDLFGGKRGIVFSLPGAFTPTCSTYQLPDFEMLFPAFVTKGIDAIYCLSVNDSFVMNAWARDQKLQNVQVIPDGSDCNPILNSSFTMKPKVLTRLGKLISLSQQIFPVHSGPSRKKILCKSLSIFIAVL